MQSGILSEIDQVSQYKNIDKEIILEAVKDAMLAAARKHYKTDEELVAEINPTTGAVEVYAEKTVTMLVANPAFEVSLAQARRVDPTARPGKVLRFLKATRPFGRIAAQMAKQVIFQKIREAERESVCAEFEGRINTMEHCTVKRIEGPELIVELRGAEARIPRREQSRLETFMPGDRVRVVVKSIDKAARGPAVIASRASEELVKRLFEQEVPEIYDETVEIKACAREAGERTKIAVKSRDRDVDAVGACVGMKGMRVQTIIRELRGEKIDIIEYIEDPLKMVYKAISPAKVGRVNVIDPDQRRMEVIVDETQLSLAIGKRGQNVRLAAKLLGWRIDIKSEEQKRAEVERALAAIESGGTPVELLLQYGLSAGLIQQLKDAGAVTVELLADWSAEKLMDIRSVGPELVDRIQLAVNECYAHLARTVGVVPVETETPSESEEGPAEESAEEDAEAVDIVLPGAPEPGMTEKEEEDDLDFDVEELERFGKINRYRGPDEGVGVSLPGHESSQVAAEGADRVGGTGEPALPIAADIPAKENNDSR